VAGLKAANELAPYKHVPMGHVVQQMLALKQLPPGDLQYLG
jgi:hypothetical protein